MDGLPNLLDGLKRAGYLVFDPGALLDARPHPLGQLVTIPVQVRTSRRQQSQCE